MIIIIIKKVISQKSNKHFSMKSSVGVPQLNGRIPLMVINIK